MELDWATCTGCKLTFIVKQSIEKVHLVTVCHSFMSPQSEFP